MKVVLVYYQMILKKQELKYNQKRYNSHVCNSMF